MDKDLELNAVLTALNLTVESKQEYTEEQCGVNIVYVFENQEEFRNYFIKNGIEADESLLRQCTFKITSKGNIIALKDICDYTIKKIKNNTNSKVLTHTYQIKEVTK